MVTSSDDSVFEYPPGGSYLNYQNLNPTVNFIDEANQTLVAEATKFCGEGNLPCIFDKVFSGSDALAEDTKTVSKEQEETQLRLGEHYKNLSLVTGTNGNQGGRLSGTEALPRYCRNSHLRAENFQRESSCTVGVV